MKKTMKGVFTPKNPQKYFGKGEIQYRSSWEYRFNVFADETPEIIAWSSEPISIPYRNPLTGRQTVYVPDYLIVYQDRKGKQHVEMIEIKPAKENPWLTPEKKLSKRDVLAQAVNAAKWQAAAAFCVKRNINFRVITEKDLFAFKRKK